MACRLRHALRPSPPRGSRPSWPCCEPKNDGHFADDLRHDEDHLFFGYYLSAAVTVPDEQGSPVPELDRRMTLCSCRHDQSPAFTYVLTAMPEDGVPLGDILKIRCPLRPASMTLDRDPPEILTPPEHP